MLEMGFKRSKFIVLLEYSVAKAPMTIAGINKSNKKGLRKKKFESEAKLFDNIFRLPSISHKKTEFVNKNEITIK